MGFGYKGEKMTRVSRSSESESRKVGWKSYATVGGTAAVAAALIFLKTCGGPMTESPVQLATTPAPIVAVEKAEARQCVTIHEKEVIVQYDVEFYPVAVPKEGCLDCAPPPVKGDKKCELDKGEGDHRSPNYDEASCGRCGDGKVGALEIPSVDTPFDKARLSGEVDVTPKTAQPEVCLADTHCGNGKVDRNVETGVLVPVTRPDGTTSYEYASVTVNESCNKRAPNYCEADCPKVMRVKVPECSEEVADSLYQSMKKAIFQRVRSIRAALGAERQLIEVSVSIDVDDSGNPKIKSGTVECGNGGCTKQDGQTDVLTMAQKGLVQVDSGRCTVTLSPVTIPVERER
ncbi:Uncharacterised protein [Candidatus Bilamarchaeum dharawalense]|uniref:Uncharacterized protein n=1 Tax=Candidatus Bilamarchaeum dharawalense TaxID=2885759 RepID=A0A5E4LPY5_9ARCH|nr:Uncharacterised protein [Candidatus Bilamarchaeum dharawalense]